MLNIEACLLPMPAGRNARRVSRGRHSELSPAVAIHRGIRWRAPGLNVMLTLRRKAFRAIVLDGGTQGSGARRVRQVP
jgi:hypothetical protein